MNVYLLVGVLHIFVSNSENEDREDTLSYSFFLIYKDNVFPWGEGEIAQKLIFQQRHKDYRTSVIHRFEKQKVMKGNAEWPSWV